MISGLIKCIIGWAFVFAFRLLPFRPPNVEPIMATLMPFSKRFGAAGGFSFAFLSIVLYDLVTSGIGMWTWITAAAYGALGIAAYYYLRNKGNRVGYYVLFSAVGTIIYDAVTGFSIGPLFFDQSFMEALVGQIPFTLWHLGGNIAFSACVSPLLYTWVVENKRLEFPFLARKFAK